MRGTSPERPPTPPPAAAPAREARWAAVALILLTSVVVYARSLSFGVTGLDDDRLVETFANQRFHLGDAFVRDAYMQEKDRGYDLYRPLQSVTFLVDSSVPGTRPVAYHATSLLLHCLLACCLYLLLLQLGYAGGISLAAALVFAAHPAFAQVVAWIPGRGDLLLGLFGVLGFWTLVAYRSGGGPGVLLLHFLSFFGAALAKETALVLPVVFAAYLLLVDGRSAFRPKNLWLPPIWGAAALAYLLLRANAMRGLPLQSVFGVGPFLANLRVLPETVFAFLLPVRLPELPSFTLTSTLTGALLAVAVGCAIVWQRKQREPMVILGCLWFAATSVPGMMYRHEMGDHAYAYLPHRAYLPMIGLLLVLVEAVPGNWPATRSKAFRWAVAAMVATLGVLGFLHVGAFSGPDAFFDDAIRTNPRSALAFYDRANILRDRGDLRGALRDYDEALRLYPEYIAAWNNRGNVRGRLGDLDGAVSDFTRTIALDPAEAQSYGNRGYWKAILGDTPGALRDYERAIVLRPCNAKALVDCGVLKMRGNDLDGAEANFAKALECDPSAAEAMLDLGSIRARRGDVQGACRSWRGAARLGHPRAAALLQQNCR
jgi:Flp pilus assembly protein TadD